jgi:hypothetical protein
MHGILLNTAEVFWKKNHFPLVPMSEDTEFAILYDEENLYIGVWCRIQNRRK